MNKRNWFLEPTKNNLTCRNCNANNFCLKTRSIFGFSCDEKTIVRYKPLKYFKTRRF